MVGQILQFFSKIRRLLLLHINWGDTPVALGGERGSAGGGHGFEADVCVKIILQRL